MNYTEYKEAIINALEANAQSDGFTVPLKGTLKRYIVGLTDNVNPLTSVLIDQAQAFDMLTNVNIGGWVDRQDSQDWTGYTKYIDISTSFDDLEDAKLVGEIFNQKAIFDIESFEEIRLEK